MGVVRSISKCPLCGSVTNTCICASCALLLQERGHHAQLPNPTTNLSAEEVSRFRGMLVAPTEPTTRYRIEVGKKTYVGAVQGASGPLKGRQGLKRLQHMAGGGKPTVYEPAPGHVRVFPEYNAAGQGPAIDVHVLGAFITIEA